LGIHSNSLPTWLDFFRGDKEACIREFGSWEACTSFYGGETKEAIWEHYRKDLEKVHIYGAEYLVFHGADSTATEVLTNHFTHTDEEVVDGCAELLNGLMKDESNGPLLFVENLWQPGFTFTDPEITKELLNKIQYPNTGIMLDTGHLMNTNRALSSPEEALQYLHSMLDRHGDLCQHIKGVHLNQSLSGVYASAFHQKTLILADSFTDRLGQLFSYVFEVDQHQPFLVNGLTDFLRRINPPYVTFEFISTTKDELKRMLRLQKEALIGCF